MVSAFARSGALCALWAVCAWCCLAGMVRGQTVLFSDDLSAGTGWQFSHFAGTAKPDANDISAADFGFDYSTLGIPEAPHKAAGDADTRGLRLAVNTLGQFAGDQVAAVYESPSLSGQYTVQVDVWLNWATNGSGIGTTEHVGVLAGFDIEDAQAGFSPGQNGAGVLYSSDGEAGCGSSGSACDYMLVKDGAALDLASGQYGEADFGLGNRAGYNDTSANANLDLQALFPSFDIAAATGGQNGTGTQPAGALGFQWVTVTLEVDPSAVGNGTNGQLGTVKVTLESDHWGNSLVLGTIDNSIDQDPGDGINTYERPVNLEGGIGLMMTDLFSSGATDPALAFALFDNVRVYQGLLSASVIAQSLVVPEPATSMLAAVLAILAAMGTKRGNLREGSHR